MDVNLIARARTALEHALGVTSGQTLALVTDSSITVSLRDAFTTAGSSLGATIVVVTYTPMEPVPMRRFGTFAAASLRPQPHLAASVVTAIGAADAAVILNADMTIMFDDALRSLVENHTTRLAWGPYLTEDALLRLLPASQAECRELFDATVATAERVAGHHQVHLASAAGTDLVLEIGTHRVNVGTGVSDSGTVYGGLEIWPGGQVSTVPDIGSAHGRLVIDRSVNAPLFKELSAPIDFHIEAGIVVDVGGGHDAHELGGWLASLNDPHVYNVTELGIGTNRRCHLAGVAAPCEDTHTLGCVSFALGADVHLGGAVSAPCHVDMTMRAATLDIDGRLLVDAGTLRP